MSKGSSLRRMAGKGQGLPVTYKDKYIVAVRVLRDIVKDETKAKASAVAALVVLGVKV